MPRLSIIVPTLEEAAGIAASLDGLQSLRTRGHEVIVVDGASRDATAALAAPLADRVLTAPRGRAVQMNAGAAVAAGDALLFLHADTRLPAGADSLVAAALTQRDWGRFDVRIDSARPMLAVVGRMMNLRSRLSGIATGDQAMFMTCAAFERAGGFPAIALMEDVALSTRLKSHGPPACLKATVLTSARRWERGGVLATMLLMWKLRLLYHFGADPKRLARMYAREG